MPCPAISFRGDYCLGSVLPKKTAAMEPDNIRDYGTGHATPAETGEEVRVKYFALIVVNDEGTLAMASDYIDHNGLAARINAPKRGFFPL